MLVSGNTKLRNLDTFFESFKFTVLAKHLMGIFLNIVLDYSSLTASLSRYMNIFFIVVCEKNTNELSYAHTAHLD